MGYTHYTTQHKKFTNKEWKEIVKDISAILQYVQATKSVCLANGMGDCDTQPEITDSHISFNGVGENAHETFHLEKDGKGWSFCKTAFKPYDLAVTATLTYLSSVHGFSVASDGEPSDWKDGLETAISALPNYADVLEISKNITVYE